MDLHLEDGKIVEECSPEKDSFALVERCRAENDSFVVLGQFIQLGQFAACEDDWLERELRLMSGQWRCRIRTAAADGWSCCC